MTLPLICFLGFLARVHFMTKGTWEWSGKTASKKVANMILLTVVIALCFNGDKSIVPVGFKNEASALAAAMCLIVALMGSMDCENPENNTRVSFVKFAVLFGASVMSPICVILLSIGFVGSMSWLYRRQCIERDYDKITFAEIILLCIENLLIAVVLLLLGDVQTTFSAIAKVVFQETVLYSINYIVIFAVKEKLYYCEG